MKVYIVTEGEYSDYSIRTVFTTNKTAREFLRLHVPGGHVEEWEAFEAIPDRWMLYVVEAMPFDNEVGVREIPKWPWENAGYVGDRGRRPVTVSTWDYGPRHKKALRVFGTDKERVHRAFYDRRTKMQAEHEGIA